MFEQFIALEKDWKAIKQDARAGFLDQSQVYQQTKAQNSEANAREASSVKLRPSKNNSVSHSRAQSIGNNEMSQDLEDSSTSAALFESPELKNFLS